MADTINKPKLQIRSGLSFNGDKSPSPSMKLLINHGKPNFTIPRANKANGGSDSLSSHTNGSISTSNNNYYAYKTATNSVRPTAVGYFQGTPATNNISNGNAISTSVKWNGSVKENGDNEATKVVLRRTKVPDTLPKEGSAEDDNVPEFIRRQRRIQERLAKENVLDFENRRSGYFTQVLISPTNPNRASFVETMASPATVPSLEMPPPQPTVKAEETVKELEPEPKQEPKPEPVLEPEPEPTIKEPESQLKSEPIPESKSELQQENVEKMETVEVENAPEQPESDSKEPERESEQELVPVSLAVEESEPAVMSGGAKASDPSAEDEEEEVAKAIEEVNKAVAGEESPDEAEATQSITTTRAELIDELEKTMENGHAETKESQQNGEREEIAKVTISHTNGGSGPSIPSPDPSGALGVNYEPKTVVSFSKDLGSEINKYPDTVKVVKDANEVPVDGELKDMLKLKFDIKADDQDVQVTPVIRAE